MILCHCEAVSDRDVRAVVEHCPLDPDRIAEACGAAQHCGACRPALDELLAELGLANVA